MGIVTVIAVCYNQAKWVVEALDSIQQQDYHPIQLIIADDGSTDHSKQYIREWIRAKAPGTKFLDHPKNLGLTKNINSALPFVEGDYFQVFGCDDRMLPTKISSQVKLLGEDPNMGIVYSDMQLIDQEGKEIPGTYYTRHTYKQPFSGNMYAALIERFIIAAPSVLVRRAVLDRLQQYNEDLDYEDHDFFLRAAKYFSFLYQPLPTVQYRVSGTSLSTMPVDELKFYRNCFLIYYQRFDPDAAYRAAFTAKLLFYTKKLYSLHFRKAGIYFFRAFCKTRKFIFMKYAIASIPFYFSAKK